MNAVAVPARFDAGDQRRRTLIAKVHLAKKELRLGEDDYRAVLVDVAGVMSAADCTVPQLIAVVERFKSRGFVARQAPKAATHPAALKARALWISLYQLGAINDPSERGLETMARRQMKVDRLQWANQALAYRLIEALKAMAQRHGWDQSLEGVPDANAPLVLRRRLVDAIVAKLRDLALVPGDWTAERVAFELAGIEVRSMFLAELGELETVAQALGAKLRAAAGLRP